MLTLRDVIDYSNLTDEEIDAIAAYEHVPKVIAAQMACQLMYSPVGVATLKHITMESAQCETNRGDEHYRLAK